MLSEEERDEIIRYFENECLPKLIKHGRNKFALLHGKRVIGLFKCPINALKFGSEQFGIANFVIRKVVKNDE